MSEECAPTVQEFITLQETDPYCIQAANTVGQLVSAYSYDRNEYLVRLAKLVVSLQKVVPKTRKATMMYLSNYRVIAGHPGGRSIYDTMPLEMYWPHMANDLYATVKYYRS